MKAKVLMTLVVGVLFVSINTHLSATPIDIITFTEDGFIRDGDDYGEVFVYGDTTTVDMDGGKVGFLQNYDQSTTNISGGLIAYAQTNDQSTINISGGVVHEPRAWPDGTINVTGGECWNVEVGGGEFNISGGQITGRGIYAPSDGSVVNIYGYGFEYNPDVPNLIGFWADGTPFGIVFRDPVGENIHSYDKVVLHEIPEPATLLLLGLGAVMLRKRC
jgi:hypothetical protein